MQVVEGSHKLLTDMEAFDEDVLAELELRYPHEIAWQLMRDVYALRVSGIERGQAIETAEAVYASGLLSPGGLLTV